MPDGGADPASRAPQPPSEPARSPAEVLRILDEVTGINQRIAQIVVAELGIQLDQFRSSGHVVSWAGRCPQAKISAGKRLSTKTGKGNRWLKQALIEAAHGAARSKNTYLGAYYQRLKKRMGSKKAIVALAHRILVIIYHLRKRTAILPRTGSGACRRTSRRVVQALGHPATRTTRLRGHTDPQRARGGGSITEMDGFLAYFQKKCPLMTYTTRSVCLTLHRCEGKPDPNFYVSRAANRFRGDFLRRSFLDSHDWRRFPIHEAQKVPTLRANYQLYRGRSTTPNFVMYTVAMTIAVSELRSSQLMR